MREGVGRGKEEIFSTYFVCVCRLLLVGPHCWGSVCVKTAGGEGE